MKQELRPDNCAASSPESGRGNPTLANIRPDHSFNWKVSTPHVSVLEDQQYNYRMGHVIIRHGLVGIYDQSGDLPYTRLDFTVGGRNYAANWNRNFSNRYLGTLATRFAASVLDGASTRHTPSSDEAQLYDPNPSEQHP